MYSYLVEFFATAFFVYIILATGNPIAIGVALSLIILLTRDLSGGYVNPAITIIMASAGKINVNDMIPFCLAQVFGALVALEIYKRFRV